MVELFFLGKKYISWTKVEIIHRGNEAIAFCVGCESTEVSAAVVSYAWHAAIQYI